MDEEQIKIAHKVTAGLFLGGFVYMMAHFLTTHNSLNAGLIIMILGLVGNIIIMFIKNNKPKLTNGSKEDN